MKKLLTTSILIAAAFSHFQLSAAQQLDTVRVRNEVNALIIQLDSLVASNPELALEKANQAIDLSKSIKFMTALADAYYYCGEVFYYRFNKDSALYYYRLSSDISKIIAYPLRNAHCDYSIAHIYYETDEYDPALEYAENARHIFEQLGEEKHLAKTLSLICEVYNYKGLSQKAIDACIQTLKIYEKYDDKSGRANVLNVIGNIYIQLKHYDKAEKNLLKALELSKEIDSPFDEATSKSTLGEMYFDQSRFLEALPFYRRAFEIDTVNRDTLGIGYSSFALGKTYVKLDSLDKGIEFLNNSLALSHILQDKDLRAHANALLGEAYAEKGAFDRAMNFHMKSLKLAEEINAYPILSFINENIAAYYEKLGRPQIALRYYKEFMKYESLLKQEENAKQIAEVDAIYDIAQKEKQIELLTKENQIQVLEAKQRELANRGLLAAIFFSLVLAGILFSRNRLKNKANKILEKQKDAINKQKSEIERQRDDIQQKSQALSEFNKQITDSIEYARLIQLSLLPASNELKLIFPESFVFNKPRDIISGDFYWLSHQEDKIYLAVVDCTGHGVPGAFMTVLANSLLNQIIIESKITSPSMALSLLDIKVKQNLHQSDDSSLSCEGMDIGLCVINKAACTIDFAGARFPFYFSNGNGIEQINGNRYPVGSGLYPDKNFETRKIKFNPGACIYMATDGFQDQFGGPKDGKFMKSKFRKLLCDIAHKPIQEQYNYITDAFYSWKGKNPQTDDILMMGIRL